MESREQFSGHRVIREERTKCAHLLLLLLLMLQSILFSQLTYTSYARLFIPLQRPLPLFILCTPFFLNPNTFSSLSLPFSLSAAGATIRTELHLTISFSTPLACCHFKLSHCIVNRVSGRRHVCCARTSSSPPSFHR